MEYLPRKKDDLKNYWVFDIEANDLYENVTQVWCLVVQNVATEQLHSFVGHEAIRRWASELPSGAVLVGHNAISYDIPVLNRIVGLTLSDKRCVDTLVLSYLYHPQMPGGHSLEAWGERFKYPKGDYNDWTHYNERMLEYCQQDVRLTRRVFLALLERMVKRGFSEKSCWIEHRIRTVIDKQERRGFSFNVQRAEKLRDRLRALEAHYGADIHKLFPSELVPVNTYEFRTKSDGAPYSHYTKHVTTYPQVTHNLDGTYTTWEYRDFNIGSPKQRVDRLLSLGWEPKTFTPTGQPKVDEDSLVAFSELSGRPQIQAIANWLVVNGRANMVSTWLNAVRDDGRIHGRVLSCGAITRRMRHNSPNTANIPGNEARFGRACRALWRATPGRLLVGYDASALEMRAFGHYLGNKDAADLYIYGDPHTANTEALTAALNHPFARKPVKTDFYAFLYGASNKKLGSHYGKSAKFGKAIRETLIENTPGLLQLSKRIEAEAESGWIKTIDGGFVRSLSPHAALNSKLQSCGGIAMKVCSILLDERCVEQGLDVWKVGDIHDEGQLDVDPSLANYDTQQSVVGELAVQCLRDAGEFLNLSVPLDGEYKVGRNWSETH